MDEIYKLLGQKVRQERKILKLTQEELAEKADITPNFLGHIERGTKQASLETVAKLAKALEISPSKLFDESEYTRKTPGKDTLLRRIALLAKDKNPAQKQKIIKLIKLVL